MALQAELPYSDKLMPGDSELFTMNSLKKIQVLTNWQSKIANPLIITSVENKYCLILHQFNLATGFSLQNGIKISDMSIKPTDLVTYRIFGIPVADIHYAQIPPKLTSNIYLTIRGDSIQKIIQNDSIGSYHVSCSGLYFRFSSKDTIGFYLLSNPTSGSQKKFSADILFWKKEKYLYLFIMFPLDSYKPIGDDEIFKMLNFH